MNDDDESDEEIVKVQKRNPDTEHKNVTFSKSINERHSKTPSDYLRHNRLSIQSTSQGRGLKPRLDVPSGFEVYGYGSQTKNIWDF